MWALESTGAMSAMGAVRSVIACRYTKGFVAYECFGSLRSMVGGKAIAAWRSVRVMGCVRAYVGSVGTEMSGL